MPAADLFARLGLFVVGDFLDPPLCERLRSEAAKARAAPATVRTKENVYAVNAETRRTKQAQVPKADAGLLKKRLLSVKPQIEEHFGVALSGLQPLQFLIYSEGDYFRRHADRGPGVKGERHSEKRQISAVVFLNAESDDSSPDSYSGGALTFYGLVGDEQVKVGLPLTGEAGLLVAFPSEVIHEVTPITRGERYSVATWFV
jgi:SM-20-related protein